MKTRRPLSSLLRALLACTSVLTAACVGKGERDESDDESIGISLQTDTATSCTPTAPIRSKMYYDFAKTHTH